MNWYSWFICGWLSGVVFIIGLALIQKWQHERHVWKRVCVEWRKGTTNEDIRSNLHSIEKALTREDN